jgi:hypothetical protein
MSENEVNQGKIISYVTLGAEVIEKALTATRAVPLKDSINHAPAGMSAAKAEGYMMGLAAAYQHSLEMMAPPDGIKAQFYGEHGALGILTELVRLKDLKQRLEARDFSGPLISAMTEDEYKEGKKDYLDNQPKAWELARAYLTYQEAKKEKDQGNRQDSHAMGSSGRPWAIGERTNLYRVDSDSPYEQKVLENLGKAKFQALSISGFDGKQACLVPLDESSRETACFIVACVHTYAQARYVATSYIAFIPVLKELEKVCAALGAKDLVRDCRTAREGLEGLTAAALRADAMIFPKGPRELHADGKVTVEVPRG